MKMSGIEFVPGTHDAHLGILAAKERGNSVAVIRDDLQQCREIAAAYDGEPSLIIWTSGSTGEPKGVVIPWPAVEARVEAHMAFLTPEIAARTVVTPDRNSGAMFSTRLAVHRLGGEVVPFPGDEGTTCVVAMPHEILQIATDPELAHVKSSLKLAISHGMPMPDDVYQMIVENLPCPLGSLYGSSETGPVSFSGDILHGCEVRIEDDLIAVRSTGMAARYLDGELPLVDGWFRTKDNGEIVDGRLSGVWRMERKPWR